MGLAAPSSRTCPVANFSVTFVSATVAGATRFAVIPCGASSSAMYRTNWSSAALAVPSVIIPSRGWRDNPVLMYTSRP